MSYKVVIDGFDTKQRAQTFIDWFEEQGEKDCIPWFELHGDGKAPIVSTDDIEEITPTTLSIRVELM